MRGIPKTLGTKQDVDNIMAMIAAGEFKADEVAIFKARLEAALNTATHNYPILSTSGKVVTVGYVGDEVPVGTKVNDDAAKVVSFKHIEEEDPMEVSEDGTPRMVPTKTELTLDKALAADATMLAVPDYEHSQLKRMGITVEEVKADIAKL